MVNIKDDFWNENGRQLFKPDLNCLRQDHLLYKTFLMQLVGKIEFDDNGISLADKDLADLKFDKFIGKAIDENVDLAITPEYSCPWSRIESFILCNKLPGENKIWILGCQSIKPNELKELITRNENVVWIYDEVLVNQNVNENKFFDPVCLIFKTKNNNSEDKMVFIIQFKTHGFGGNGFEWERDNCIPGNTLYVIENQIPSTRLVTIICSDTLQGLDFNTLDNYYFKNSPLLLIHIQLNQKPFQSNYKNYRNSLFSKGRKEDWNKEIICLNWAKGVTYDAEGEIKVFNEYGGSALYCKTEQVDLKDERINKNHSKGLYYTCWINKKSHIYFLNYEECLSLIDTTKPSQINSDPTQMQRSGPVVLKTFIWNSNWVETAIMENGFQQVCLEIEDNSGDLSCLIGNSNFTDVERLIQLSSGEFDFRTNNWSQISNLFSFQISDTEINNRNTFTQDPDINAKEKRNDKITRYNQLKNKILKNPQQVPSIFLNANVKYEVDSNSKTNYLINLYSIDKNVKGTGIYLGNKTLNKAKAIRNKIENLFKEDQQGKQLIVWYNNPDVERLYNESTKPEINENVSKSTVSYKKTR